MSQSIEVVVRLRPSSKGVISPSEIENDTSHSVSLEESTGKVVLNRNRNQAEYTFTRTFGPEADQSAVYSSCDVIPYVLDGVNCCVMTYGQTSTGKTYTMYGKGWEDTNSLNDTKGKESALSRSLTAKSNILAYDNDNDSVASAHDSGDDATVPGDDVAPEGSDHLGIIPRSINDLFDNLNTQQANKENFAYSISLQIMQVYNEKIYDLLHDRKRKNPLVIRETSAKDNFGSNVYVRGLSVYRVDSKADAFRLIKKAIRNKAIRSTELNSVSSRSHTVLQLFVMTEDADADGLKIVRRSTLSLIDLAGSEKWRPSLSTTGSIDMDAQVKEMTNINASLHVLGNCIAGLIESDRKHIPYRDSVLTRLLQSTLGGNGKSIIVATIHSDSDFVDETYSTLQFATRASKVKVTLAQNVGVSEKMSLSEAQKHIKMLKKQLEALRSGNASSTIDLSNTITMVTDDNNSICQQCRDFQQELQAIKQRMQMLEEENKYLKQRCEELTLNSSAFYSNQSSVESSPVVKSSSKKKKSEKNASLNSQNNNSNNKDKGVLTLTSPMLLTSSLSNEPLQPIPEHRSYHNHSQEHSDVSESNTSILQSSLDRMLLLQAMGDNKRQSYDSDSSSISGLHSILHAKSPADIAAAALKAASDFENNVPSSRQPAPSSQPNNNSSSVSGSILGIQVPDKDSKTTASSNKHPVNNGFITPTAVHVASGKPTLVNDTFATNSSTAGLPPPSPALSQQTPLRQSVNNQGHAAISSSALYASGPTNKDPITTGSNSVRTSSNNLLSSLLGTPITGPITLNNQGGVCQKHNLEDCILCAMFSQTSATTTTSNNNNNSSSNTNNHAATGAPLSSSIGTNPFTAAAAAATGTANVSTPAAVAANTTPVASSWTKKFSATPLTSTAPSQIPSVNSSITSILKAANNNTSTAHGYTLDSVTPGASEFGISSLRRSKAPSSAFKSSAEDDTSGKCRHGLLNCFLCNGVPAFDYSSNANTTTNYTTSANNNNNNPTSTATTSYKSTITPRSSLSLPPMMTNLSTQSVASNNHAPIEMISTLDSPQNSQSSFPLSSKGGRASGGANSKQDTATHHRSSASNDPGSNYFLQQTFGSTTSAGDINSNSNSNSNARVSSGDSHKSKRVQEIQAITQLRQSHHLEQQQQLQQLQQKAQLRSSSSPFPIAVATTAVSSDQMYTYEGYSGNANATTTADHHNSSNVRSSLVKQLREQQQQQQQQETIQYQQQKPPLRYTNNHHQNSLYQNEDDEENHHHNRHNQDGDHDADHENHSDNDDDEFDEQVPTKKKKTDKDNVTVKKKKLKKKKTMKKVSSAPAVARTTTAGSDTDNSVTYAPAGAPNSTSNNKKVDAPLLDQYHHASATAARPSSKHSSSSSNTLNANNTSSHANNAAVIVNGEKVINHRTVMMALKGGKKK